MTHMAKDEVFVRNGCKFAGSQIPTKIDVCRTAAATRNTDPSFIYRWFTDPLGKAVGKNIRSLLASNPGGLLQADTRVGGTFYTLKADSPQLAAVGGPSQCHHSCSAQQYSGVVSMDRGICNHNAQS